ncbi:MAG: DUF72 domain-containing protein [Syntrophales bacterium]|nr:DUF72 domain-containing protein [Syntrophales bacterium]
MGIFIGTSGWTYTHWAGTFYPHGLPRHRWISFYMTQFPTVELNASFYRSIRPDTYIKWRNLSPPGFLWSVKVSRVITHIKRLKNCEEAVSKFLEGVSLLGERLGCLLIQLPPSLSFERETVKAFRPLIPHHFKVAIEARNKTWFTQECIDTLRELGLGWCISDTAGRYPYREEITTDFVYIRLHGSQSLYRSCYTDEELETWKEKIKDWKKETYVYFDNDYMAYAPFNAARLIEMIGKS